jgi:hypothetical protein
VRKLFSKTNFRIPVCVYVCMYVCMCVFELLYVAMLLSVYVRVCVCVGENYVRFASLILALSCSITALATFEPSS